MNIGDISINKNFALSQYLSLKDGLTEHTIMGVQDKVNVTAEDLLQSVTTDRLGFLSLLDNDTMLKEIKALSDRYPSSKYTDIIVLGIGGSALGTRAIKQAFMYTAKSKTNIHVLDNIDPVVFSSTIQKINPLKTLVIVVSKSGETVETLAQFFILFNDFKKVIGVKSLNKHFVFITTTNSGALFQLSVKYSIPVLPVPQNVGGRYSVLSAVGLFPASFLGINISELINGGKRIRDSFVKHKGMNMGELAVIYYLMHKHLNKNIMVFMPYSSLLTDFSEWIAQLWAESLGKRHSRDGKEVYTGSTPVRALGVTDQHSQLQLYKEGPADKLITFIEINRTNVKEKKIIPVPPVDVEFSYLFGKTLDTLLHAEMNATRMSLINSARPSLTISIPELTPKILGELFVFFELLVVFVGYLYQINPFDQPGVEEGKRILKQLLK
ncbi:MAG: glucose-6-phosphate isomerase [bacterium]